MSGLQVYNPRERALVGAADLVLRPLAWFLPARAASPGPAERVLILRLERIGDLLMARDAIADARAMFPTAKIDLAVGSWNLELARLIPGIDDIHVADVPWLARNGAGDSWSTLRRKTKDWKRLRYDLVINIEPDIRSNYLAWRTRAPRRVGYWTGGGGPFLTDALAYEPGRHVSENARRIVAIAASANGPAKGRLEPAPPLRPSVAALSKVATMLRTAARPLIGVHVSGGRESKQWHLDRFAGTATELARATNGTIVLTGSPDDRSLVDRVKRDLAGTKHIDVAGSLTIPELAALLSQLDVLVTGDTGPMHLAAAVGTPVVALFGPSDPSRYGPIGSPSRVLRVQLPCSPCGQVRLPPERCRGHVPDCMDGIQVARVVAATLDLLDETARIRHTANR